MGDHIGLALTPNDIHVMEKSEYSGVFGDYSTFSDEMDEDRNNPGGAKTFYEPEILGESGISHGSGTRVGSGISHGPGTQGEPGISCEPGTDDRFEAPDAAGTEEEEDGNEI